MSSGRSDTLVPPEAGLAGPMSRDEPRWVIEVRRGDADFGAISGATFLELVANLLQRGVDQALIAQSDADMRNLYGLNGPVDFRERRQARTPPGHPPAPTTGRSPAATTVRASICGSHAESPHAATDCVDGNEYA